MSGPSPYPYSRLTAVRLFVAAALGLALFVGSPSPTAAAGAEPLEAVFASAARCSQAPVAVDPGALALDFAPNRGQSHSAVRFEAHSLGSAALFLSDGGTALIHLDAIEGLPARTVRLAFPGAAAVRPVPGAPAPAVVSYRIGDDTDRWVDRVETYRTVVYGDLWPGIDLAFRGDGRRLDLELTVAPQADPGAIRWRLPAHRPTDLSAAAGRLHLRLDQLGLRRAVWLEPQAWQDGFDGAEPLAARYVSSGGSIGLEVSGRDPSRPLYLRATFAHTPFFERYAAVRGESGVLLTGGTPGVLLDARRTSGRDAFVAVLDADGRELETLTLVGGAGDEIGRGLAVADGGELLVVGTTASRDLPSVAAFQAEPGGGEDAFVLRLTPSADTLLAASYLGGRGDDGADDAAWAAGAWHVTGRAGDGFPDATEATSFAVFLPQTAAGLERYFVARLAPEADSLAGASRFTGPRLDRLAAWTGCDRRTLHVGVPFVAERNDVVIAGASSCPAQETPQSAESAAGGPGLSPVVGAALPCPPVYTLDTYQISVTSDFSTCPSIGNGWGYHSLCWKSRRMSVPYNAPSSGVPTGYVVGQSDADTLNAREAETSVFPNGNPSGGWFGTTSQSAAELAVGAAISMDRWDAPSYSNLHGAGRKIGIKRVVFEVDSSVGSMSSLCSAQGWSGTTPPEQVAQSCINSHGGQFLLDSVRYDWWDSSFHANRTDTGLAFGQAYNQFEPWVSDPPDEREALLVSALARRLRGRVYVRLRPADFHYLVVENGRPETVSAAPSSLDLVVRLIDLGL